MIAMNITSDEYRELRAWLAHFIERTMPGFSSLGADVSPIAVLDRLAARSPAKARQGLAMAINDMVETSAEWPQSEVESFDQDMRDAGLFTLSEVRLRFSAQVKKVMRRGSIRTEGEFYAIRNAVDIAPEQDKPGLWRLIDDYEGAQSVGGKL
jgi:hypothetical protein